MENYSHHHHNGNVMNRSSINIAPFNTNFSDEIEIFVLLIRTKSFGLIWSFGENTMRMYMGGRQISNRQEEVHIN